MGEDIPGASSCDVLGTSRGLVAGWLGLGEGSRDLTLSGCELLRFWVSEALGPETPACMGDLSSTFSQSRSVLRCDLKA